MQNAQAPLDRRARGPENESEDRRMLESIRNAAQGVVGKAIMTVVMGLIIVSFVIWGVGDMLRGFSPSTVASVGGAKISAQDYRSPTIERSSNTSAGCGTRSPTSRRAQIGLDRSVLQQLLSEAAVDDEAHKLGLDISDDACARSSPPTRTSATSRARSTRLASPALCATTI